MIHCTNKSRIYIESTKRILDTDTNDLTVLLLSLTPVTIPLCSNDIITLRQLKIYGFKLLNIPSHAYCCINGHNPIKQELSDRKHQAATHPSLEPNHHPVLCVQYHGALWHHRVAVD